MKRLLICSILAIANALPAQARADCAPAGTAAPDAPCIVGVKHGERRGVWSTVAEYDVLTRKAADARELSRQVTAIREAHQERILQVDALQRAVTEVRAAATAADARAEAAEKHAAQSDAALEAERQKAGAWYRSPIVGAVVGAGLVLVGGVVVLAVTR